LEPTNSFRNWISVFAALAAGAAAAGAVVGAAAGAQAAKAEAPAARIDVFRKSLRDNLMLDIVSPLDQFNYGWIEKQITFVGRNSQVGTLRRILLSMEGLQTILNFAVL
jgi:hypothetical protein